MIKIISDSNFGSELKSLRQVLAPSREVFHSKLVEVGYSDGLKTYFNRENVNCKTYKKLELVDFIKIAYKEKLEELEIELVFKLV